MRKRKLEEIKNGLFTDILENKDSAKIFSALNNPDIRKDIMKNIIESVNQSDDDFIDKCVKMILMAMRQKKIKLLQEIDLSYENVNYPFPPIVRIINNGKEIICDFEDINPKELQYELDSLSADVNLSINVDPESINAMYTKLEERLKKIEWGKLFNISDQFMIKIKR
jgi:hypothetical protein